MMQRINKFIFFEPQTGEFISNQEEEQSIPDPEIVFFKSDKSILIDETPALLSWEVRNASSVTVNNVSVGSQGTMPFHSFQPQMVIIKAKNEENKFVEQSLNIDIDKKPPFIHYFDLDKMFVIKNFPVRISWQVTGAKKITIDNGIGDVSNRSTVIVTPTESGVYKLTAQNFFGFEAEATSSITIFPAPMIEGLFIPCPQSKIQNISLTEPSFNLQANVYTNIEVAHPVFTQIIALIKLDTLPTKILLNKRVIDSVLFPNNIFKKLIEKQKEISYIIKSLWKRKLKEKLKRHLK